MYEIYKVTVKFIIINQHVRCVHSCSLLNWLDCRCFKKKTVFSCRLCFLGAFPSISLILLTTAVVKCLCGGCKKSPRTTSLCSHMLLALRDHGVYLYVVYNLTMEFRSCGRGRQWYGIIHFYWWTASIKPRLMFSRAGYASWGLSLSSVLSSFT